MEKTDFSFMKSGFDNTPLDEDDMKKNIVSILIHFTENAIKSAAIYVKHCNRNVLTTEDIKRGMMLEAFLFGRRENAGQKVEEIKREIFGIEEEDDEDFEDLEFAEEDEKVQFTESEHDCGMCKCFNSIYDRWGKWKPENEMLCIIKKHINQME
jgi:hypothetical protein